MYPYLIPWNVAYCFIFVLVMYALPRLGWSRWWMLAAIPLDVLGAAINSSLSNNPHFFFPYPVSCILLVTVLASSRWLDPGSVAELRANARRESLIKSQRAINAELMSLEDRLKPPDPHSKHGASTDGGDM